RLGAGTNRTNIGGTWCTLHLGFCPHRVAAGESQVDLNALADLPLTYPEVGATATGRLPAGYNHLDVSTQIGTGRQRFEQAADARWTSMRWPICR
ncbi:hypothetical protein Z584_03217, partial [Mycobacterium tuberculosis variant bovis B2 7505]